MKQMFAIVKLQFAILVLLPVALVAVLVMLVFNREQLKEQYKRVKLMLEEE